MCPSCGSEIEAGDHFCGFCGIELHKKESSREDVFSTLSPALGYYFLTLIVLAVYKLTDLFSDGLDGIVTVTIIDILIVIVFWAAAYRNVEPLFSLKGIKARIVLLVILGSLAGSVLITGVAELIQVSISDDVFYDPYFFEDTPFPLVMAVLFVCVHPAIFEEVAFRGFLFNNIVKVAPLTTTVYITAFIFGIMHLSAISLLWLVPIGLVLGWLRAKYDTLWYGMIGHFTYNLGIISIEWYFRHQ